jgi:hypothetical protein
MRARVVTIEYELNWPEGLTQAQLRERESNDGCLLRSCWACGGTVKVDLIEEPLKRAKAARIRRRSR